MCTILTYDLDFLIDEYNIVHQLPNLSFGFNYNFVGPAI